MGTAAIVIGRAVQLVGLLPTGTSRVAIAVGSGSGARDHLR
ncbi:hypothetical protein [Synechococcus sp. CCY 9618]|nr:hypothetical protein [Synechococcus sp. CCY 9618]